MDASVGTLSQIYRYPVKSLRGESLLESIVENYGLYGDRSHAFLDKTRRGEYLTARQAPNLLGYKAEFTEERKGPTFPNVKITSPEGRIFNWDDEALETEIETVSGRRVSKVKYSPDRELLAVDDEHIHIITVQSLRKLEYLNGDTLEPRRFRANFLISLEKDTPFLEDNWLGKRMMIGEVELEIKGHCPRCNIVNIDPDKLELNYTLLKTIVQKRKSNFGIYASVVKKGTVKVGDEIVIKS
ncbi:MOSC domain-containing protein [Pseudalkalibacillus decolorationis]|uniref:MOSC domain-containing protein n=1 Tax=Pseudalkalibacillus decolorationis TaxID=163879 RepID=UPI0021478B4D|nr:MOSC domain-containing protein [Pseudalkalibacillus decolorationis]